MRMDPAKKLLIHLASDQICIIALQMQRGFFHRQCRIKKANICYVTAKRMMYEYLKCSTFRHLFFRPSYLYGFVTDGLQERAMVYISPTGQVSLFLQKVLLGFEPP